LKKYFAAADQVLCYPVLCCVLLHRVYSYSRRYADDDSITITSLRASRCPRHLRPQSLIACFFFVFFVFSAVELRQQRGGGPWHQDLQCSRGGEATEKTRLHRYSLVDKTLKCTASSR
jgi:hypothetical protein